MPQSYRLSSHWMTVEPKTEYVGSSSAVEDASSTRLTWRIWYASAGPSMTTRPHSSDREANGFSVAVRPRIPIFSTVFLVSAAYYQSGL